MNIPVTYELYLGNGITKPCISFIENGGSDEAVSDELTYSSVNYTVKVWADSVQVMSEKAVLVDGKMKELGFKRVGSNELTDNKLFCKVLNYQATGQEGTKAWY